MACDCVWAFNWREIYQEQLEHQQKNKILNYIQISKSSANVLKSGAHVQKSGANKRFLL